MVFKTMPKDFNKRFDIVGCCMECDGEFLLLLRHPHKASGNKWGLPAGKREDGETLTEAVLREVEEETGIVLAPSSVEHFRSVYSRDGSFDLEWHMFSTKLEKKPIVVIEPSEHSEFKWVSPREALGMDLILDLDESIQARYGADALANEAMDRGT